MFSSLSENSKFWITIVVASLGYFVDVFDIVLYGMVRVSSLTSLGVPKDKILEKGILIYNSQLIGMLVGGFFWGVIGDKIGRVQVLFGSIIIYSVANLANAYVGSVETYLIFRFFAGLGLAGEVGAAVTLVAEIMKKENRGIGTSVVATSGTLGALTASLTGHLASWQNAYLIGGSLGLLLLLMRFGVHESGMFSSMKNMKGVKQGDLVYLFSSKKRVLSYLTCVLSGTPLFFTLYVMIAFAPELGNGLEIVEGLTTAKASLYFTSSMVVGDFMCGLLSQYLRSRKRALFYFVSAAFISTSIMLTLRGVSAQYFYLMCLPTGFFIGYWAVYVTTVTEQFGTNLRATITTSALNLVRATPIIMTFFFVKLKDTLGVLGSMQLVGILAFLCSFYFLRKLKETFEVDLNYVDEDCQIVQG